MSMKLRQNPDAQLDAESDILDAVLAAANASASPAADKSKATLSLKRLQDSEIVSKRYRASIEAGVKFDRVLQPGYWFTVSSRLRAGDEIVCIADDCSWRAELLVIGAFSTKINVAKLSYVEIDVPDVGNLEFQTGHRVEARGLVEKFCVVRARDGVTLATGLETAELAQQLIYSEFVPRAARRGFS